MGQKRHNIAGSIGARVFSVLLLVALQVVASSGSRVNAAGLTPVPSVQQAINGQQSASSADTNDLLWFSSLSNKWTLLGAMNFAVSGTTGTSSQTCASSIDTVQDGVSWRGMAGYNGANGWTFTLPNTWKGQNILMAPYWRNSGTLFSGWGCRDISGQLGSNATYPARRTATNGSVYPFMWADTFGGLAQNGSFTWEHAFNNLDPATTYKFQYLTVLAGAFCSLEDITTTGTANGVSQSVKNLAVTNNAGKTKGSQLVTSTVSGVTEYIVVRKGSGTGCNHMGLSAIQVHASVTVPQVSSLSVPSGPRSGGTTTVINGNNLLDINSVTIGGSAAIVQSTTEDSVTILTPAGSVGAADIVIGNGIDVTTMKGGFSYTNQVAPSLQLSLDGNLPTTTYGMSRTISAQVSTSGSVTFKTGGVAITGCSNVAAVSFIATCSWLTNAANSNSQLTADFTPTDQVTYTTLTAAGLITHNVQKAAAVVVASSPSVEYGDAPPLITASIVGLVNSDNSAVVTGLNCVTTYTATSPVGSSPSTSCAGGSAANYALSYTDGSVSVSSTSQASLALVNSSFDYGTTLLLSASGGSGTGDFSYSLSSSGSAGCTRNNATISASTTGTCTISATRDASGNYASRSQNFTITVNPSEQDLLMIDDVQGSYGSPLALSTSGGSGTGAVSYVVTAAGTAGCSLAANGTDLLATSAGTCSVTATKAASATHRARTSTDALMTYDKIAQPTSLVLNDTTFTFGATLTLSVSGGNGGGALSYGISSGGSAGCSIAGSVISASSGGICSIIATRGASTNYISHTESFTISVNKASQSILTVTSTNGAFAEALSLTYSGGSGSGIVTYLVSSTGSAGCSIFAGTVTVSSPGTCTVVANKASDDSYLSKNSATTLVTFSKGTQSSLTLADDGMLYGDTLTLSAGGGNGDGAISYALLSAGTADCSFDSGDVTSTTVGTCTISVTKAATAYYFSKNQTFTITVGVAPQIGLSVTSTSGVAGTSTQLTFSGGSGNGAVTWSVTLVGTARCGVIGSTLLATTAGTCTVRLTKAVDDNYLAATVAQVITVTSPNVPSNNGQQSVPTVTAVHSTTTTSTTTTTVASSVNVSGGKVSPPRSVQAPPTTSTTIVGIEQTLQKKVGQVAVSEALMVQGDSSFAATVTRQDNSLVMVAGLFKAVIRGIDVNGNLMSLDPNGDIRIPVGGSVSVNMGQYQPNSQVFVWMFSKPRSLGEQQVDARGNVTNRIATPKNVEQGLHRLAFVGKSPSGRDITFMVGLIVADPSTLSTMSKVLIAIPITLAVFAGFLIPTSIHRRRQRRRRLIL